MSWTQGEQNDLAEEIVRTDCSHGRNPRHLRRSHGRKQKIEILHQTKLNQDTVDVNDRLILTETWATVESGDYSIDGTFCLLVCLSSRSRRCFLLLYRVSYLRCVPGD